MDKEILRQYYSLRREIKEEEIRISKLERDILNTAPRHVEVTDVVTTGKRGKKPLGSIKISGFGDQTSINRKRSMLREHKARKELKLARLEALVCDVEDFIDSIPDSETRRIMRFFYLDGLTWAETAAAMGEGYSADACRMKVKRILR